jgi:hypothetical protein
MACGQFGPSAKNQQNISALLGATAAGGCVPLQSPNGTAPSAALSGFTACASSDPASVVLKYSLSSSGNPICLYSGSGGVSFNSTDARCFTPSTPSGSMTVQFSSGSFNTVAIVLQQDQGGFQTVGFGGISVPYVVGKFR